MTARSDEIEAFKAINLLSFAASYGYVLDRKASSRNSAIMVGGTDKAARDKIVIAKASGGHYVYFCVHDPSDHGSIIDFVQRRSGGTLGDVRKCLRPWIGTSSSPPPTLASAPRFPELQPLSRDIAGVRARYEAMRPLSGGRHDWLTGARALPPALLADPLFATRIRVDGRGNAVFPHWNRGGICGYSLKNAGFTGFAKGGAKGLWCSTIRQDDSRLVIAESAIDALSYAALFGAGGTRFISMAGQVSPEQCALVASAMRKLPAPGEIILAFDHDKAGDALVTRFSALFRAASGDHAHVLRVAQPAAIGADWNDALCAGAPALRERGQDAPGAPCPE